MEQPLATPAHEAPGLSLKGDTTVEEPGRAERAVGRHSAETRATVPDLELAVDVDAEGVLAAAAREGCSPAAVLISGCAAALREHPRANASYRDGRFELYSRVNVGVVLPVARGQTVATVFDADAKSLVELEEDLVRLRARAESGELTPPEQAGTTFTFSDLGPFGIHRAAPLITPPQAAALTAGAVRAVPVVRDGEVRPGHVLTLTVACDHRILFGAAAARFLASIARNLEAAR